MVEPVEDVDPLDRRGGVQVDPQRDVPRRKMHDVAHHRGFGCGPGRRPERWVVMIDHARCVECGADVENHAVAGGAVMMALAQTVEQSGARRSEEHTSELQSLMRISYAVFCLKKKNHV